MKANRQGRHERQGWILIDRLKRHFALALLASVSILSPSPAAAQSPPNPNFQRQQLYPTYQDFKTALTTAAADPDPTQLDALWTQLRNAGQVPYAQGNQVAFLYRGTPGAVSVPGDFNGWSPTSQSWQASRVGTSNLWMLEKTFPTNARLDYKLVTGGSNWILDPANSLQMWSGFGPNSELRMPDYVYPQETVRQTGVARGDLSANIRTTSAKLGYDVNYRVYTPAGYAPQQLRNLPTVYVTDGHEYSADHMGSMVVVLDNLIAAGTIQPTVAVFIDPRDPNNANNNRRTSEYVQNPNFAGFVADELVPKVDAAYRTLASPAGRTILGTSLGGMNSAYFGATKSDVFRNIAIQSPASFPSSLTTLYNNPALVDKLHIYMTAGTIGDGSQGPAFASLLASKGYDYKFVQLNEGHSWGNWRGLLDNILVDLVGLTPVLAADFNDDGAVNAADLSLWQAGSGKATAAVRSDGDADGDRDVDGSDFLLLQQQLGSGADCGPRSESCPSRAARPWPAPRSPSARQRYVSADSAAACRCHPFLLILRPSNPRPIEATRA